MVLYKHRTEPEEIAMEWPFEVITLEEYAQKHFAGNSNFTTDDFVRKLVGGLDHSLLLSGTRRLAEKIKFGICEAKPKLIPAYDRKTRTLFFSNEGHVFTKETLFYAHNDVSVADFQRQTRGSNILAEDLFVSQKMGWVLTSMRTNLVVCSHDYHFTKEEQEIFLGYDRLDPTVR